VSRSWIRSACGGDCAASADGIAPGYPVIVFGGSHADVDELAAALGKKPSGGHWNSGIAVLRNNGLIETDGSRRYRSAELFRD
jgi:hypothetical protein